MLIVLTYGIVRHLAKRSALGKRPSVNTYLPEKAGRWNGYLGSVLTLSARGIINESR